MAILTQDQLDQLNALTDFVMVTNKKGDSIISIDQDGAGTDYGWTQIATLEDVKLSTDESLLVTQGVLLVS